LWASRDKYLNRFRLKGGFDLRLQEWAFREPTHHEDETNLFTLSANLGSELLDLALDVFEKGLEEVDHQSRRHVDAGGPSLF
jgi:hypothetical protein